MPNRSLIVSAACLVGLLSPAYAERSDANIDVLATQMAIVVKAGERHGYSFSSRLTKSGTGSLRHGRERSHYFTLRKGMEYQIVGVCDNDCRDLDLKLYDENDNLIDKDFDSDDYPVVKVRPRRTAKFRAVAQMESCSANPCGYVLTVLEK